MITKHSSEWLRTCTMCYLNHVLDDSCNCHCHLCDENCNQHITCPQCGYDIYKGDIE